MKDYLILHTKFEDSVLVHCVLMGICFLALSLSSFWFESTKRKISLFNKKHFEELKKKAKIENPRAHSLLPSQGNGIAGTGLRTVKPHLSPSPQKLTLKILKDKSSKSKSEDLELVVGSSALSAQKSAGGNVTVSVHSDYDSDYYESAADSPLLASDLAVAKTCATADASKTAARKAFVDSLMNENESESELVEKTSEKPKSKRVHFGGIATVEYEVGSSIPEKAQKAKVKQQSDDEQKYNQSTSEEPSTSYESMPQPDFGGGVLVRVDNSSDDDDADVDEWRSSSSPADSPSIDSVQMREERRHRKRSSAQKTIALLGDSVLKSRTPEGGEVSDSFVDCMSQRDLLRMHGDQADRHKVAIFFRKTLKQSKKHGIHYYHKKHDNPMVDQMMRTFTMRVDHDHGPFKEAAINHTSSAPVSPVYSEKDKEEEEDNTDIGIAAAIDTAAKLGTAIGDDMAVAEQSTTIYVMGATCDFLPMPTSRYATTPLTVDPYYSTDGGGSDKEPMTTTVSSILEGGSVLTDENGENEMMSSTMLCSTEHSSAAVLEETSATASDLPSTTEPLSKEKAAKDSRRIERSSVRLLTVSTTIRNIRPMADLAEYKYYRKEQRMAFVRYRLLNWLPVCHLLIAALMQLTDISILLYFLPLYEIVSIAMLFILVQIVVLSAGGKRVVDESLSAVISASNVNYDYISCLWFGCRLKCFKATNALALHNKLVRMIKGSCFVLFCCSVLVPMIDMSTLKPKGEKDLKEHTYVAMYQSLLVGWLFTVVSVAIMVAFVVQSLDKLTSLTHRSLMLKTWVICGFFLTQHVLFLVFALLKSKDTDCGKKDDSHEVCVSGSLYLLCSYANVLMFAALNGVAFSMSDFSHWGKATLVRPSIAGLSHAVDWEAVDDLQHYDSIARNPLQPLSVRQYYSDTKANPAFVRVASLAQILELRNSSDSPKSFGTTAHAKRVSQSSKRHKKRSSVKRKSGSKSKRRKKGRKKRTAHRSAKDGKGKEAQSSSESESFDSVQMHGESSSLELELE